MALVAVGAAIAITLLLWKPWGGAEQKDFSIDLETNDDFQTAARRIQEFFPDFNCDGSWKEETQKGLLQCEAGLAGFGCEFKYPHPLWSVSRVNSYLKDFRFALSKVSAFDALARMATRSAASELGRSVDSS